MHVKKKHCHTVEHHPTDNTNTSSFVHQRRYFKNGKHHFSLPLQPSSLFLSLPPFDKPKNYFLFPFDSKAELYSFLCFLFVYVLLGKARPGAGENIITALGGHVHRQHVPQRLCRSSGKTR